MGSRYQYQNTRQWVRVPCEWYVKYAAAPEAPEALVTARDASAGGLRLVARDSVEVGTRLHLKINVVPLQRTLSVVGRVAWVRAGADGQYEWGVAFEQIDEADRAALRQYTEEAESQATQRPRRRWWRAV